MVLSWDALMHVYAIYNNKGTRARVPLLLSFDEKWYGRLAPPLLSMLLVLLSCAYLLCAQAVFVVVVGGYTFGTEGCVAIAFPSPA